MTGFPRNDVLGPTSQSEAKKRGEVCSPFLGGTTVTQKPKAGIMRRKQDSSCMVAHVQPPPSQMAMEKAPSSGFEAWGPWGVTTGSKDGSPVLLVPKARNSVVGTCQTSLGSPHTPGEFFAGKLHALRGEKRQVQGLGAPDSTAPAPHPQTGE